MPPSKKYFVNDDEFQVKPNIEYSNLKIHDRLGAMERIAAFLRELAVNLPIYHLVVCDYTHGGYIPIECAPSYLEVDAWSQQKSHISHLHANINEYAVTNVKVLSEPPSPEPYTKVWNKYACWFYEQEPPDKYIMNPQIKIIVNKTSSFSLLENGYRKYIWDDTGYDVHVHESIQDDFARVFESVLQNDVLTFDNLLHFCMIVKNGGHQLEEMLQTNAPFIDRWTIVDTGSTDNTVEMIERVLKNRPGRLYRNEFVDFSTSRNICFDYAEKQHAVPSQYYIMLDDTYVLQGNIRNFFKKIRGDRFANSFSVFVSSYDSKYVSNRVITVGSQLRYKYRIHEVLEERNNINVVIPMEDAWVLDRRFDYMETRTFERKRKDLVWLEEEIRDNPTEPRHYYYMAQTYMLLGEYEKAYEYFKKRVEFAYSGFIQERIDAVFEMARLSNFHLKKPWSECQMLYQMAYTIDPSRPESLYYMGIHYAAENQLALAYDYLKQGFLLGYPEHCQHSLKPTLCYHFLPFSLTQICFLQGDMELGQQAVERFLKHNPPTAEHWHQMKSWEAIFHQLLEDEKVQQQKSQVPIRSPEKPLCVMVVDGGFQPWTGSDIVTKGVGGSETCMIELAQHIQKLGFFQVVIFCHCSEKTTFRGVEYRDLQHLYSYVHSNKIHTCIVSRYTQYLAPLSKNPCLENLYLILHDLMEPETVIISQRLKRIYCLTDWHKQHFQTMFPGLSSLVETFSYGVDFAKFDGAQTPKIPHSFIYSSYPERGLLPLLQCWPRILNEFPDATLHIFCNVDNPWSNAHYAEQMQEIRQLLDTFMSGVVYRGWVNKTMLAEQWKQTEIWFYPCTFQETFCLTALEAATSKVLVLTNGLAALQDTANKERTVVIPGDPHTAEWKEQALQTLFRMLQQPFQDLVERNYQWAQGLSWQHRAKYMNDSFQQEKLETRGMCSWYHEVPSKEEKDIFVRILTQELNVENIQEINIIEVGVWSGVSLIPMIKILQNTFKRPVRAIAIDTWENYEEKGEQKRVVEWGIEESFDNNIRQEGLQSCVEKWKGKSVSLLQKCRHRKFDFIYVDGSHLPFDCFADCLLAWQILKIGGILGIDDYLYQESDKNKSMTLQQGVDTFLNMIQNEAQIIHQGYRVFVRKMGETLVSPKAPIL